MKSKSLHTHSPIYVKLLLSPCGHTNEINKSLNENCLQSKPAKRNAVHHVGHKPWLIFSIMTDCLVGPPTTF